MTHRREPSCAAICGVSRRGASMTDYGSFAQGDGFFADERGRNDEKDFASTGQQFSSSNVVKQLSATSFGQNFPPCTSQITEKLQLPNDDICAPDLEDVRRAAKRFIETTISSTYACRIRVGLVFFFFLSVFNITRLEPVEAGISGLQEQSVNKWNIYNGDVEDAEFARVLDNLPTSYDDFESKVRELHLKLERNLSSPLMTCQSPNADSGRVSAGSSLTKSSNMYLCDTGSNPPDADDLEVAMINQSFEEQQKQTKIYASPGLKDLFYSQPNTRDDRITVKSFDREAINSAKHALLVASDTHKSDCSEGPLFPADLLLTGASTNSIISEESLTVGSSWTVCREKFAKTELKTVATVKSSDIQKIAGNSVSPKANTGFDDCENIREFGYNGCSFDVEEMILDDTSLRYASQEAFGSSLDAMKKGSQANLILKERIIVKYGNTDFICCQLRHFRDLPFIPVSFYNLLQAQDTSSAPVADDNMDATEALAVDVVESLFDRSGLTETSYTTKDFNNQDLVKSNNGNDMSNPTKNKLISLTELMDGKKKQEFIDEKKKREDVAVVPNSGAVDSWEELDNDDYNSKLIEIAMCKVKIRKPKIDYFSGPLVGPWDDNLLPHVLEAFNLPVRFTEDDVKQELAKHDCADVAIHPVDDTHCLVVFASRNAALQAMIAVRQRQNIAKVRLRSLCDATRVTQEKARKYEAMLRPHKQRPQTTPLVARRLIEGALGKRSNVSVQQISNERKQLKDAKEGSKEIWYSIEIINLKQVKAAIWEDGP
ncbi:hypothetical protein X798_04618 [Onchocerca flexuosa]|uniref:Uncharacterized protein n=1 Tax=Onchocerca flexuosa TaxID=387005 RepID=A0A238BV42_9BILA|nr:hypothetical protein X798_04618 [Onchocerca flexuosa]